MKFWEAMRVLDEGHKVRHYSWYKEEFIRLDMIDGLLDEKDSLTCLHINNDSIKGLWLFYEEQPKTYTFMEAIQFMKQGKCIKRKDWSHFIDKRGDSQLYWDRIGAGIYSPTISDIEATDWTIVEDKK